MGQELLAAVADTGPLIHLAEIGSSASSPERTERAGSPSSSLFVTQAIVELAIENLQD